MTVSIHVAASNARRLVADAVHVKGSATGRLAVAWVAEDDSKRHVVSHDLSAAQRRHVDLPQFGEGELELTAVADAWADHPASGVIVAHPRLENARPLAAAVRSNLDPATGPNILVYLIDALRSDHLGCYGGSGSLTPEIDRFAEHAFVFVDAQAQSSWTRPAVASLFTGMWPQQHGANDREDLLSQDATTLAGLLKDRGYATAGIIANGNIDAAYGFDQGFDYYKLIQHVDPTVLPARSEDVGVAVTAWLDSRPADRPFFLYVHTIDPHAPYSPPDRFRALAGASDIDLELGTVASLNRLNAHKDEVSPEVVQDIQRLYAGEVAANDAAFGSLMQSLAARGLETNTVIVLLSDHGEEFFEHKGWSHGNTLYREVLDIPLVVRIPEMVPDKALRVSEVVQQIDVFASLLDLAGIDLPEAAAGRSFLPLCRGDHPQDWHNRSIAYLNLRGRFGESLTTPGWKLIWARHRDRVVPLLFDRRTDPLERSSLSGTNPERLSAMSGVLEHEIDGAPTALSGGKIGDRTGKEVVEQLKALGYVDSGS